jgi:hypothetical protein
MFLSVCACISTNAKARFSYSGSSTNPPGDSSFHHSPFMERQNPLTALALNCVAARFEHLSEFNMAWMGRHGLRATCVPVCVLSM